MIPEVFLYFLKFEWRWVIGEGKQPDVVHLYSHGALSTPKEGNINSKPRNNTVSDRSALLYWFSEVYQVLGPAPEHHKSLIRSASFSTIFTQAGSNLKCFFSSELQQRNWDSKNQHSRQSERKRHCSAQRKASRSRIALTASSERGQTHILLLANNCNRNSLCVPLEVFNLSWERRCSKQSSNNPNEIRTKNALSFAATKEQDTKTNHKAKCEDCSSLCCHIQTCQNKEDGQSADLGTTNKSRFDSNFWNAHHPAWSQQANQMSSNSTASKFFRV